MNKNNKQFLLETSIIIAHLKQLPEAELIGKLKGEKFSSAVCLAELYEGIFLVTKKNQRKVKQGIDSFFKDLDGIIPITEKEGKIFGEIRADLRKKGKIIEDIDLLIAASCLSFDLTLVTLNYKHFQRVPNLKIYDPGSF